MSTSNGGVEIGGSQLQRLLIWTQYRHRCDMCKGAVQLMKSIKRSIEHCFESKNSFGGGEERGGERVTGRLGGRLWYSLLLHQAPSSLLMHV